MNSATSTKIDLTDTGSFRFWTPVTIRYSDQDAMAHVNNCAYAAYTEAGRTVFLGGLLNPDSTPAIDFILASVKIDYLNEMHYPGTVNVGTRIIRLGTKSMTLGTGMFHDGACVATAESVNIFLEVESRQTIPIPVSIRATLDADPMQKGREMGCSPESHS